jgi:Tfp pilus assembly protein FimT
MQIGAAPRNSRGYSIGELLWVIVILGIIAALAIPRLDWIRYRINAEARNVSLQLAYAQRLAVSLQHNVLVTIDHANRRMAVDEDANNDGLYGANERRRVVQLQDGVNFESNGVAPLPPPSPSNELLRITYRRDGSADQPGVVYLNSVRGLTLGNNKDSRALEIVRSTGRAFWYSYTSGSWVRGQ